MRICIVFFCVVLLFVSMVTSSQPVYATPQNLYTTVRVKSFHLTNNGDLEISQITQKPILCTLGDTAWGCGYQLINGAYVRGYPYPENPKTFIIETEYLPNVVPFETDPGDGFGTSALQAQSVAARTYVYSHIQSSAPGDTYDVDNSISYQFFQATGRFTLRPAYPQSDAAINATRGYYLARPTSPSAAVFSEFSSDHDPRLPGAVPFYTLAGGDPALQSVYDPITNGEQEPEEGPNGHGRGLSQQGARKWGNGLNFYGARFPQWDYTKILAHYYTGVNMFVPHEFGNPVPAWGAYRWNLLKLEPSSNAEIYYIGKAKSLTLRLQNTGSNPWETGTTLRYRWRRQSAAGLYVTGWSSIGTIAPRNPGRICSSVRST